MGRACKCCKKEIKEFYKGAKNICKKCYIERQVKRSREKRILLLDYLKSHPCEHCGEGNPVVLEFHHSVGKDKEYSVSQMTSYSVENILKEISKCQVLCSNCHKIVTAKEFGWYLFD